MENGRQSKNHVRKFWVQRSNTKRAWISAEILKKIKERKRKKRQK